MQKPEMKKCNGHEYSYSLTCGGCHKAKGYNQGLQAGLAYREMNWIKCEDRLPEDKQKVLAITDYGMMCTMQYRNKEFFRIVSCRRCDSMGLGGLTHWQPLPAAPKAEGEAG